ncbi:10844_t:CDS:2, partial [Racocetra persica]
LFTKLLLPKIKASQPARIVNLSSLAHRLVPERGIEFEKLNDPIAFDSMPRYAQSKLANILFTDELNKRYLEGEQSRIEEKNYLVNYFEPFGNESERSTFAEDDDLTKRLWKFTENLI